MDNTIQYKLVNGIQVELLQNEISEIQSFREDVENNTFLNVLNSFRNKRNLLLTNSDWTQMPDSPLTDAQKTEWQTYRQSLRDLTNGLSTVEEVETVIWPVKPE